MSQICSSDEDLTDTLYNMAGVLICKIPSAAVLVIEVDEDVTIIKSNLRKLKLFLPVLYVTEKKKMYLLKVVWSKYLKFQMSQLNELSV